MSVLDANSNFNYRWTFKDYPKNQHNLKVFSTFACGGGSTMGYKLAGYDVIGSNDIDPQLAEVYKVNHHPKYQYICPIKDLATIDLPKELFDLDILDGSPPCSTFSTAGLREKAWGKDKHFREGQTTQILDDLFFDFLDVAELLQPKVIVAENVSGMLKGNAKGYLLLIFDRLKTMGYTPQIFLLDASTMGVPQRRQRVFIIANRMNYPKLTMNFNLKPIPTKEIIDNKDNTEWHNTNSTTYQLWQKTRPGESFAKHHPKGHFFGNKKIHRDRVSNTVVADHGSPLYHDKIFRTLNSKEYSLIGSFPLDYNYMNIKPKYLIGMSVPPVMMAQVANQIYLQWLGV